ATARPPRRAQRVDHCDRVGRVRRPAGLQRGRLAGPEPAREPLTQADLRAADFLAGAFLAVFFAAGFLAVLFFGAAFLAEDFFVGLLLFFAGFFSSAGSSSATSSPREPFAAATDFCSAASRSTTCPVDGSSGLLRVTSPPCSFA